MVEVVVCLRSRGDSQDMTSFSNIFASLSHQLLANRNPPMLTMLRVTYSILNDYIKELYLPET